MSCSHKKWYLKKGHTHLGLSLSSFVVRLALFWKLFCIECIYVRTMILLKHSTVVRVEIATTSIALYSFNGKGLGLSFRPNPVNAFVERFLFSLCRFHCSYPCQSIIFECHFLFFD